MSDKDKEIIKAFEEMVEEMLEDTKKEKDDDQSNFSTSQIITQIGKKSKFRRALWHKKECLIKQ